MSGTNRQLEIGRLTVSFQTEAYAKSAASAIIASGHVKQRESEPAIQQVPVEIRADALIGPFFLLLPVWYGILIVTSFFLPDIVQLILGGILVGFFFWIFRTIYERQMRAGPAAAWFRPRVVKAQLYIDDGDLVVNAFGREEAFLVSTILWMGDKAFKVTAGKTGFEVIFQSPDDATRIASMIRFNSTG